MLTNSVQTFIQEHLLIRDQDRIAVAFSGGPDSTCLLHILHQLYPDVEAIYMNHNLRPDSSKEEEFVKQFCVENKIPLHIEQIRWNKKPANLEEVARKKRYRHLEKVAKESEFTRIALAHHQDDLVETILLRILRGTGPTGLIAMKPIRGKFIRPLLFATHSEIVQHLKEQSIQSYFDPTNLDRNFLRNRVRHELLPYLESQFNPAVRSALLRLSSWSTEQTKLIEDLIQPFLGSLSVTSEGIDIERQKFLELSLPLEKELLRKALVKMDPNFSMSSRIIAGILKAIQAVSNLELPGYLMVQCSPETIQFSRKTGAAGFLEIDVTGAGSYPFPPANTLLKFSIVKNAKIPSSRRTAFVDAEKASFPLAIRNWKKGDNFQPLGMKGKKKLSDFWIDRKVPRTERKRIPIVIKDDRLVWIVGYEIDDSFKITSGTRKVLKIELDV